MRPSLIHELLQQDSQLQTMYVYSILESQSIDERPTHDGYFITISMGSEIYLNNAFSGPRDCVIAVHHPSDIDRDYGAITDILNRVDKLLLPVQQQTGSDGVRVSQIIRGPRSGNLLDEGYRTIVRTATYRVSCQEFAA